MILAIAALLVHFPAVPQVSLPGVSSVAANTEPAAREVADDGTVAGGSGAAIDPASNALPPTTSANETVTIAALEPGRLTPTPVASASVDPAINSPMPSPSSPTAAAFIASSPGAVRMREERRDRERLWFGLGIAQSSAAAFDAWTTRRVISSGGGQELNPMLRPFAGNASLYAAIQVAPLLLDYLGRHMMNSRRGWERRTWWVPQSAGTAMSVFSGIHNLGVQ